MSRKNTKRGDELEDRDLLNGLPSFPPGPDGIDPPTIEKAKKVHDEIARRALRQPDVVGVDIGYLIKESKNSFVPEVGIRFHVETKLGDKQLQQLGRVDLADVDQVRRLFSSLKDKIRSVNENGSERIWIGDVPIDVVEAQYSPSGYPPTAIRSRPPRSSIEIPDEDLEATSRSRIEPLVGGVSLGIEGGPAGTVGLVVYDRTDGRPCILSNWHVLAGFEGTQLGRPCYQPAVFDGGTPADRVGHLKRWIFDSSGDAALAELDAGRPYAPGAIFGLWFPVTDVLQPWLGMRVKKWGRSTGFSQGFIDGVYMSTDIPYGPVTPRHFEGQIHISPRFRGEVFSEQGDSGSVVVADFAAMVEIEQYEFGDEASSAVSTCNFRKVRSTRKFAGPPIHGLGDVVDHEAAEKRQKDWNKHRTLMRSYYAVGLLFAGDTAASRFGEFALATPMDALAESLDFCIQPVFVPQPDMIPQVSYQTPQPRAYAPQEPAGPQGSGRPPQPVSFTAGRRSAAGGPQPDVPPQPDPGP